MELPPTSAASTMLHCNARDLVPPPHALEHTDHADVVQLNALTVVFSIMADGDGERDGAAVVDGDTDTVVVGDGNGVTDGVEEGEPESDNVALVVTVVDPVADIVAVREVDSDVLYEACGV